MPTNATRLSDRQLKAVKATGKDFVLSDGDGLQLRVRASGPPESRPTRTSLHLGFRNSLKTRP